MRSLGKVELLPSLLLQLVQINFSERREERKRTETGREKERGSTWAKGGDRRGR